MPTNAIAITVSPDLLNAIQGKLANSPVSDGFLALLNIGTASLEDDGDNAPAPARDPQPQAPQPVAAPIEVATPIVDNVPPPPLPPSAPAIAAQPAAPASAPNAAPVQAQTTPPSNSSASTPASASASDNSTSDQNATLDLAEKELRTKLQNQLGNIGQLLVTIIQALGGNVAAPAASPVTTATTGATAAPAAGDRASAAALAAVQAQLAQGAATDTTAASAAAAPVATDASATPTIILPAGADITLFKDMQALLQQMQQFLQTPGTAPLSADAATSAQAGPQTPVSSLQSSMETLVQSLQTQMGTQGALPMGTGLTDDVKTLLKNSISQIKDQLQQLKQDNENVFAMAKAALPPTQPVAADILPPLTASGSTGKDNAAPTGNNAAAIAAAPVAQAAASAPIVTDLQPLVQALVTPVAAAIADNSGGGTTGDNAGGGQQQQTSAPVMPVATSAAQATTGSSGATFARALTQVAQTPLLDQVVLHVKTAAADGSSKIHIQLDPADLGKLDIKLTVGADGKTGMVVTADNKNTLDLLQRDSQTLTRALNDAGLKTDSGSLSFNLRGGQQEGQGQQYAQGTGTYQKAQPDEEEDATAAAVTRSYVVNLSQGLDIKI